MMNWQPARPPGLPSKSAIADTLMTSGKAAGTNVPASDGAVASASHEHDARRVGRADRRVERVVGARAPGPRVAPAHVGDVDVVGRVGVGVEVDHVVDPAQDERLGAVAGVVERP